MKTLLKSCLHFPNKPDVFIFSGGGRLNKFLLKMIKNKFSTKNIFLTENYNWNGDAIEAYAFGYLAVRKLLNLPITFPKTTGVKKPLTGGNIFNL